MRHAIVAFVAITALTAKFDVLSMLPELTGFTWELVIYVVVSLFSVPINPFSKNSDDDEDDEGGGDGKSESDDDEEDKPRGGMCTINWGDCSDYKNR